MYSLEIINALNQGDNPPKPWRANHLRADTLRDKRINRRKALAGGWFERSFAGVWARRPW